NQFQKTTESWGVGYRKEDKELGTKVNNFIEEYKKNGGFNKLSEKYLGEQKQAFEERNIPFFF
ncbi:MAG: transporter substrate-binding domain-containing protein, partial [Fusobacteriaceae bacterium]